MRIQNSSHIVCIIISWSDRSDIYLPGKNNWNNGSLFTIFIIIKVTSKNVPLSWHWQKYDPWTDLLVNHFTQRLFQASIIITRETFIFFLWNHTFWNRILSCSFYQYADFKTNLLRTVNHLTCIHVSIKSENVITNWDLHVFVLCTCHSTYNRSEF